MSGNDLERHRAALLLLARAHLARHRNLGLDASDLVQRDLHHEKWSPS